MGSPNEPSHEVLPRGQHVALGRALQLSVIDLYRCEKGIGNAPRW